MTLFQSADRQPLNHNHYYNPSLIEQLHDDPEPSAEDSIASYSANPEEILMAKEALLNGHSLSSLTDGHFAHELNEDADYHFYAIAPTTTNLKERNNNPYIRKSVVELTKLRSKLEDNLWVYPYPQEDVAAALIKEIRLINKAESFAISARNFGV
jgi:hypothetical protein